MEAGEARRRGRRAQVTWAGQGPVEDCSGNREGLTGSPWHPPTHTNRPLEGKLPCPQLRPSGRPRATKLSAQGSGGHVDPGCSQRPHVSHGSQGSG